MAELWLLISAPSICPRSNSSISPTPSPLKMCDLDSILLAEHYWVLRYSDPVIRFALAHCLRDRLSGLASKKRTQKLCHFLVSWFGFRSQWATDSRGNYGGVGGCKRSR